MLCKWYINENDRRRGTEERHRTMTSSINIDTIGKIIEEDCLGTRLIWMISKDEQLSEYRCFMLRDTGLEAIY